MGATRNTGYLENLIQYDSSDNVAIATSVNPSYKVTLGGSLLGTSAVFSGALTSTLSSGIFLNNSSGGTNATQLRINNTSGDLRLGIESSTGGTIQIGTSAYAAVIGNQANNPLQFTTNGTTRMTITSGGNVLIGGTVVQNTSANRGNLTINGTTSILNLSTSDTNAGYLYHGGTDMLLVNAKNGATLFYTNDTERMRITSGGLIGINATNPFNFGSGSGMVDVRSQNTSGVCGVFISNSDRSASIVNYINNAAGAFIGTSTNHYLDIGTNDVGRMRITSGGNVEIGTGSLSVANGNQTANSISSTIFLGNRGYFTGANVGAAQISAISTGTFWYSGTALAFYTNPGPDVTATANVERMRITSGGNVLIGGTTAASVRLGTFAPNNTSSSYSFVAWNNSGNDIFAVRGDGIIQAVGTYNNTTSAAANVWVDTDGSLRRSTSSLKYKNNIQSYDKGLDVVSKLRPVYYNGINDGKTLFAGLIAEEVHDLGLTEFVQYAEDGSPDALAYQNMVALLTKAIQEQQAQIEELKSKLN